MISRPTPIERTLRYLGLLHPTEPDQQRSRWARITAASSDSTSAEVRIGLLINLLEVLLLGRIAIIGPIWFRLLAATAAAVLIGNLIRHTKLYLQLRR